MNENAASETLNLTSLLPHGPGMIMLEKLRSHGENFVECEATVGGGKEPVDDEGNVPAWVGLEYMAQTAAALAGIRARARGEGVAPGLLLGSRFIQYESFSFPAGEHIVIRADLDFDGDRIKVFECQISDAGNGSVLQRGKLNVYLVRNEDEIAQEAQ